MSATAANRKINDNEERKRFGGRSSKGLSEVQEWVARVAARRAASETCLKTCRPAIVVRRPLVKSQPFYLEIKLALVFHSQLSC